MCIYKKNIDFQVVLRLYRMLHRYCSLVD